MNTEKMSTSNFITDLEKCKAVSFTQLKNSDVLVKLICGQNFRPLSQAFLDNFVLLIKNGKKWY